MGTITSPARNVRSNSGLDESAAASLNAAILPLGGHASDDCAIREAKSVASLAAYKSFIEVHTSRRDHTEDAQLSVRPTLSTFYSLVFRT